MNLSKRVSELISVSTNDLHLLQQFVKDYNTFMQPHIDRGLQDTIEDFPEHIRDDCIELFGEFAQFTATVADHIRASMTAEARQPVTFTFKPKREYPREVQACFLPMWIATYKPVRYPDMLYSMALTHMLAIFESMLEDFLIAIFTYRTKTLKSRTAATYEEIFAFSSMKKLTDHLAKTRAHKILEDYNIDRLAEKLRDLFGIDVSQFGSFEVIREASYRRNVIIHNKGFTDNKYCEKIPGSKLGVRLSVNFQYIDILFAAIGEFIDRVDESFSRKVRYKRNPTVNVLLNPLY